MLFASLVDDPSSHPDKFPTEEEQEKERERLFGIIERLVKWENSNNQDVLAAARAEILKSTDGNPPPVYDPFCGGGSIPLEAQRLGLEAHGSDLNPVAVLITKALIEIPPKFKDMPPVNPEAQKKLKTSRWYGAQGLAEDVRYYGKWMRDEAEKRIGHLYPKVVIPPSSQLHPHPPTPSPIKGEGGQEQEASNTLAPLSQVGRGAGGEGKEATVIAGLWARTVKCPNPACGAQMPLVRSFALSTKKDKQAWVEPVLDRSQQPPVVRFEVKTGNGKPPDGTMNRKGATCICCSTPVPFDYIRTEGKAGRMSAQLMSIVAEGQRQRVYVSPNEKHEVSAAQVQPKWKPEANLPDNTRDIRPQLYGMPTYGDLFTPRQLVALNTFSDLVDEIREQMQHDAVVAGLPDDSLRLSDGGIGATAYADAVATYLGMGISRLSDICNSLCRWENTKTQVRNLFARQAIPMLWDFAEPNMFAEAAGDFGVSLSNLVKALERTPSQGKGFTNQLDATEAINITNPLLVSTDPPYYSSISYAELSDFFYIWLRRSLGKIYPNLFSTLLVPKGQELVATPYRFGGDKKKAEEFFEKGLRKAFSRMREVSHAEYPLTVYYAFKQAETEDDDDNQGTSVIASTGWETMLEGLIQAGLAINGTWPIRTELSNRPVASGTNALATSIVLVCRPRPESAPSTTRRQFLTALKRELPEALHTLQQGNIAPVDLAQASIGPGMAVFSRYAKVLEADGTPMRVRTALQLINQTLDEFLTEQEGEFDADTRWALTWFEQHQFEEGKYGDAETLSKAKNTSVTGLVNSGILNAKGGKVRLLRRDELPDNWTPEQDDCTPDWEVTQHLIRALDQKGESGASVLLSKLGDPRSGSLRDRGEVARDLAYRLYSICDRKGWTQEAIAYNSLVISWPEISRLAAEKIQQPVQGELF